MRREVNRSPAQLEQNIPVVVGPPDALRHPVVRVTTDDPRHDHRTAFPTASRPHPSVPNSKTPAPPLTLPAERAILPSPDVEPSRVKAGKLGNWGATHSTPRTYESITPNGALPSVSLSLSLSRAGRSRFKCRLTTEQCSPKEGILSPSSSVSIDRLQLKGGEALSGFLPPVFEI